VAEAKKQQQKSYVATGRRKTAVARVRLSEGSGQIAINGKPFEAYFTEDQHRNAVTGPLELTEMRNRLDLKVLVDGGGFAGQAGAISLGLARALKMMFGLETEAPAGADGQDSPSSAMAKKLRDSGYLTRDGRMKERKKYGRKGARKSFQFSKR
jgi:small subunit ribosomal protein S9